MAMPVDFVMVRHGQSEANLVHKTHGNRGGGEAPIGFYDRHDTHMRLSEKGRAQAVAAGRWLLRNFAEPFDTYYVSPLVRTRETAGAMAINGEWRLDDRWREQDWGEYGAMTSQEQRDLYRNSTRMRDMHKWFWCPPGGESLATGVRLRFDRILQTAHRESEGQRYLAVTHGEMMSVARYVLERMDPDQWLADDKDPTRHINNCQILHYTRRDPGTGETAPQLRWMRSICPWDPKNSWEGGDWVSLPPRRVFNDAELLESVESHPRLLAAQ